MRADAGIVRAVSQRRAAGLTGTALALICVLAWAFTTSPAALAQTPEPPAEPPQDEPVQPVPPEPEQPGDKPETIDPDDVNEGPLRDPVLRQDESDPRTLEREPEVDPLADGPPPEKEDVGPMEICAQPAEDNLSVLQRVRRSLTVTACASSAWLDGLFGDQIHYDDYHATYGTLTVGGLWSDYDGFDPRLRFRARLQLPQWDERISAFAGRVGEDDYISDTEGDFDALPTRQFGTLEDESVLLGLGYSSPERTGNDFDVGVGVRVDLPLDPYARARYEVVRSFAERYVFSARETVFWQNTEGFGTTTRINLDRVISDRFLLRWSNLGKYTEETLGVEWYTQLTLFQSVGQRTGLAWQAQVEGATDNEVQLTRHALRLIMRRQLTPEWLILELRGGVGWPRRKLHEEREATPEIGVAIEMQFGQRRDRLRPR
ncbi:MAG TPA: hypothetical protein VGD45_11300 [Steroidobacter sp.]|uniref:hypothetical protein n=1 Tax=Steroidobacter sp. TaxID=1978227 RepID=UPI002ED7B4F7